VALARAGKPINAGAYLALCGAAGIDPVDCACRPAKAVSSTALFITRGVRRVDQRSAAKLIGVSCRVEAGKPVSIANTMKVCAFIGVHPDGYTTPLDCPCVVVSRETPTETCCPDLEIRHGDAANA
jgi:Flp pilus assembly CpaE family ATPase